MGVYDLFRLAGVAAGAKRVKAARGGLFGGGDRALGGSLWRGPSAYRIGAVRRLDSAAHNIRNYGKLDIWHRRRISILEARSRSSNACAYVCARRPHSGDLSRILTTISLSP